MLRHAGIAAGDALARNAARATGARSVSMLCVPDPRSRTTRGRGPPFAVGVFRPFAHPRRARKAPNLTRPPRISLAPTADQTSRLHPHDCRTQILDGSVWCARVSPATRPDPRAPEPWGVPSRRLRATIHLRRSSRHANRRTDPRLPRAPRSSPRQAAQVPQGQARRRGRVRQQVLREHELPVRSPSMGRVRGPGQLQRVHRALRVARLAVSRGRRARAGDAHGAKVPGEVHRERAHHRRSGGDVPAQGELLQQAGDAQLEEVHPVVPALSSSRVFFYSLSTLRD